MTSHQLHRIEAEAAESGFKKIWDGQRTTWRITCFGCRNFYDGHWGTEISPELMCRNMNKKGWDVRPGRNPLCHDCRSNRREPMADKTAPLDTPAPALLRKVMAALEEVFLEKDGSYRNSYTDQKVADETGAALLFVVSTRMKFFGELKEDPRIAALRADIAALRKLFEDEMALLSSRLNLVTSGK